MKTENEIKEKIKEINETLTFWDKFKAQHKTTTQLSAYLFALNWVIDQ